MQQITEETTQAVYAAAATLEGVWNSPGGYYSVTGGSAYMEIQYAPPGQGVGGLTWTNEVLVPVGNGNLTAGTTGVRFRDAGSAGGPAVVTAALSAEAEPLIIVGAPGAITTTPAAGGVVTGIIPAAGNTQTAGTGFTYSHTNGTGVYVFTFAPAFAAPPLVHVTLDTGNSDAASVSGLTAAGFTVNTFTISGSPPAADKAFSFSAQPVV